MKRTTVCREANPNDVRTATIRLPRDWRSLRKERREGWEGGGEKEGVVVVHATGREEADAHPAEVTGSINMRLLVIKPSTYKIPSSLISTVLLDIRVHFDYPHQEISVHKFWYNENTIQFRGPPHQLNLDRWGEIRRDTLRIST